MLYFLNGFMGSGKSHWGERWAKAFDLDFYDLDAEIERQEGAIISKLFETEGEPAFRRKESVALSALFRANNAIVACGGGTPCFHDNIRRMNKAGISIFLQASVEELTQRLLPELGHRPVLAQIDAATLPAFIEKKLTERDRYYQRCFYHFSTRYLTDENFKKILERCKKHS